MAQPRPQFYDVGGGVEVGLRQWWFEAPVAQKRGAADRSGLRVWPSALLVLKHVHDRVLPAVATAARRSSGRAARIVELGSGCGLVGLGLAAKNAEALVVLTDPQVATQLSADAETDTLAFLRRNVELNGLGNSSAEKLLWGRKDAAAFRDAFGPFDLVVGSDLLYAPDHYGALLETMLELKAPVVLGYQHRHAGEQRFLDLASKHFEAETTPLARNDDDATTSPFLVTHFSERR
ncbi:putative methyltransferase-domain-containing protein [Pelagophyceae sp. CCMP2097]|nr:putative methyltransferase-domain-containing protein [Pelagophyceae sp. CCMP2097]|mmetsp:Transcript_33818/g.116339  ORF Transcript_33818/g.116339 Transcript_33818/m.116339 type:complete len:235 (+) Transcript_33818:177-881(+)|eukprot:CAMPEP_0184098070 /NCGR_PEP_ID=MMETSP0974-20121125/11123_1 /TAXON_ID=483370 /ORGANISM="non described non described, Strain CCMP2097" /LENGTH=234 /DNA_ID=CAMNT_0026400947 /DNA_START=130 /DNA_END=834 /DNA_ORIENTATION=-